MLILQAFPLLWELPGRLALGRAILLEQACQTGRLQADDIGGVHHGHWMCIVSIGLMAVRIVYDLVSREAHVVHVGQKDQSAGCCPFKGRRDTTHAQGIHKGGIHNGDLG